MVPPPCSSQAPPWRAAAASRLCLSPSAAACNKRAACACTALRSRSLAPCMRRGRWRSAGFRRDTVTAPRGSARGRPHSQQHALSRSVPPMHRPPQAAPLSKRPRARRLAWRPPRRLAPGGHTAASGALRRWGVQPVATSRERAPARRPVRPRRRPQCRVRGRAARAARAPPAPARWRPCATPPAPARHGRPAAAGREAGGSNSALFIRRPTCVAALSACCRRAGCPTLASAAVLAAGATWAPCEGARIAAVGPAPGQARPLLAALSGTRPTASPV